MMTGEPLPQARSNKPLTDPVSPPLATKAREAVRHHHCDGHHDQQPQPMQMEDDDQQMF